MVRLHGTAGKFYREDLEEILRKQILYLCGKGSRKAQSEGGRYEKRFTVLLEAAMTVRRK